MDIKKTKLLLLEAAENSINELIKVMNKKMNSDEIDPEKVKVSASAYRLAMDDAMAMIDKVEELTATGKSNKDTNNDFFGVESQVK
jgi:hypothetical protein|tara:strand:+ start:203 stop:460 length:258 start_codon:yes stop_codon:yes gene_type:complete